jgi:hypothetical protein
VAEYEIALPRILEWVSEGQTLNTALKRYPVRIEPGPFTTWIYAQSDRKRLYEQAKEIRTEAWAGEMVRHALGEETLTELDRSKHIVETYKWLISRENRKQYGDTKTIEMSTTVSITAALSQAGQRVIEATVIDDDEDESPHLLTSGSGEASDDHSTSKTIDYDDEDDD